MPVDRIRGYYMKICFICDIHLPESKNALQHKAFQWALEDICKNSPDCLICAGDLTCAGSLETYRFAVKSMNETGLPLLYIPGNSDLRSKETKDIIAFDASPVLSNICRINIIAVNDSDGAISDETYALLDSADKNTIVFMHHYIDALEKTHKEKMLSWRDNHKDTPLFTAHKHFFTVYENDIRLPALDPDKNIGEEPAIVYYDTDTRKITRSHFPCPMPKDLCEFIGISAYTPGDIRFAIEQGLKYLELRNNITKWDENELIGLIAKWRNAGGVQLSIHLPDIGFDEKVLPHKDLKELLRLAKVLKAQRFTQHVPKISVKTARENKDALESIAVYIARFMEDFPKEQIIGIENMHMTEKDSPDDSRRFGYLPEEVTEFMRLVKKHTKCKVGINFDNGHARNNAPYSREYQLSSWYEALGLDIVGYHLHQVISFGGEMENHTPFTEIYGRLISLASFFRLWQDNEISHAPVILEMRTKDAYPITLKTFGILKEH